MAHLATEAPFHPGELAVHRLLRVSHRHNPTHHGLPPHLAHRVAQSPLVAFGALDRHGRPWATVWGGSAGFCGPLAPGVLGVRGTVDVGFDPVVGGLLAGEDGREGEGGIVDDAVVRPDGRRLMAGLSIDPETRDRVKLAGAMVAGTATRTEAGVAELQIAFRVDESLGNCPKYISRKHIVPRVPSPRLVSAGEGEGGGKGEGEGKGVPLPKPAIDLLAKADMFFLASKHGAESMDVNIRGGPPGFTRVLRNDADNGSAIVYPEYSGNRLYQTLGNLQMDPDVGIVVPDYETGDVLYLTGRAAILVGTAATTLMPRAKLAVRVEILEARFVQGGLPFRGEAIDFSPYNPAVRRLACEKDTLQIVQEADEGAIATATLVSRETLTPTVSRYVFKVAPEGSKRLKAWRPGQHVTLDFGPELDMGYSHMRDDDPQSLNDDFVRTFTVSRELDEELVDEKGDVKGGAQPEFEITARRHGAATRFLERWNTRVPLEIPVLGFGGAEEFRLPISSDERRGTSVFIAAGVGITPLTAQATSVLRAAGDRTGLRVLWSLKGEDIPLAVDVLRRIKGLGSVTRLFVTGNVGEKEQALITTIQGLGAQVEERRIGVDDVLAEGDKGRRKYYLCVGPGLMKELLKWTEGEDVVYESFEY